jgi:NADH:ubiquinone oxidoreductase subunit
MVGTDEYGNQYFEEIDMTYYSNKRWVEFSEAHRFTSVQGTKIPPPWHGWLAYTYDEAPNV